MEVSSMNHSQKFYADRLQAEMQRLWDNGTLNQEALDELKEEHFRYSGLCRLTHLQK